MLTSRTSLFEREVTAKSPSSHCVANTRKAFSEQKSLSLGEARILIIASL